MSRPIGWAVAAAYIAAVAGLGALGFARDSTLPILLAGALALPFSIVTGIFFYLAYGFLALVPGANPSESTGSCTAAGCESSSSGDLAAWFLLTTDVLGVLALTAAAVANVVLVRHALRRRRLVRSASAAGGA